MKKISFIVLTCVGFIFGNMLQFSQANASVPGYIHDYAVAQAAKTVGSGGAGGGCTTNCTFAGTTTLSTTNSSGTYSSSVASGSNAIKILAGARIDMNSGTDTHYIDDASGVLDLVGFQDIQTSGYWRSTTATGSAAVVINTGAKMWLDGATAAELHYDGTSFVFAGDKPLSVGFTDGKASTGNQTINKPRFKAAYAAAASAITITNSTVAATSMVLCTLETVDTTCKSTVTAPAAGSVVITTNAACNAQATVSCIVFN